MDIQTIDRGPVYLLGKMGYVTPGSSVVADLWTETNCHAAEIFPLALKNADGKIAIWGAMSDRSLQFYPWEKQLSEGYYLAGMEVAEQTAAPEGWIRWVIPAFRYVSVRAEKQYKAVMREVLLDYLPRHQLTLVGAIQEYYDPARRGELFLLFPIERL